MRIPKRMALAISGAAFAGATALALGAAPVAGAQITTAPHNTIAAAPHHAIAGHVSSQIRTDGWGWDEEWGWSGGGWDEEWGW
jgi:hypothetical protein